MAAGLAVVFACGVLWLALFAPGADARSLGAALAVGFYPFVAADVIKLCLAAAIMPACGGLRKSILLSRFAGPEVVRPSRINVHRPRINKY